MPEKKKSRPKFFAPKPPLPPTNGDVVNNHQPDQPPKEDVVEAVVDQAPPGPKLVTRELHAPQSSPLTEILTETLPVKTPLPVAEPTPTETENNQTPSEKPKAAKLAPTLITPDPMPLTNPPSSANPLLVGITVFALVIAVAGWAMYFNATSALKLPSFPANPPTLVSPSPAPTSKPVPTPNPRQTSTLEVLNGSGVAGEASQIADQLKTLGYTVSKTGNADNQKYAQTTILVSPGYTQLNQLLKDLATIGPASKSGDLKNSSASAQIIIGKNWAK